MKNESIDEETKMNMLIYGNRKQLLNDYLQQIESNIEFNILSN